MKEEVEKKITETQAIYQEYLLKVKELRLRQEEIVIKFLKKKEDEQIVEIRNKIKSQK